jgi:hypothetical protein
MDPCFRTREVRPRLAHKRAASPALAGCFEATTPAGSREHAFAQQVVERMPAYLQDLSHPGLVAKHGRSECRPQQSAGMSEYKCRATYVKHPILVHGVGNYPALVKPHCPISQQAFGYQSVAWAERMDVKGPQKSCAPEGNCSIPPAESSHTHRRRDTDTPASVWMTGLNAGEEREWPRRF